MTNPADKGDDARLLTEADDTMGLLRHGKFRFSKYARNRRDRSNRPVASKRVIPVYTKASDNASVFFKPCVLA